MGVILRVLGVALGFFGIFILTVGFNILYTGIWVLLAYLLLAGLLFSINPNLNKAPSAWFLFGTLASTGMALWMLSAPPLPIMAINKVRVPLPPLMFILGLVCSVLFVFRNRNPANSLPLLPSFLILLMTWAIIHFSGPEGGAGPMVEYVMKSFSLGQSQAELLILVVRKTIHFTFYGVLALVALHLVSPRLDWRTSSIFGLLLALSTAGFDEFSQAFATNRSASFWDIGLDMLGAITFVGLSVLRYRHRLQPQR